MRKVILLLFITFSLFAQEENGQESHIKLLFGNRDLNRTSKLLIMSEIDFLDYLNLPTNFKDYQQLGLSFRVQLINQYAVGGMITSYDDLSPRNFELYLRKGFAKKWGLEMGGQSYQLYLRNYPSFIPFDDFESTLSDQNYQYIKQNTVYLAPYFTWQKPLFRVDLSLKSGIGLIGSFIHSQAVQSTKSFEIRRYDYRSTFSPFILVQPQATFAITPFVMKKSAIGLEFRVSYAHQRYALNYQKSEYKWTLQNKTEYIVKPQKSAFRLIETDFGIIWRKYK